MNLAHWFQAHWIELGVALWAVEKALELIATLTPSRVDDNIGIIVGKFLSNFWKRPA